MKRLSINQIEVFKDYLMRCKISPELYPEILDHFIADAEEHLWEGMTFDQAFKKIILEANSETLLHLSHETRALLAEGQSLNDMVFEGRNQQYGAYALRKGYGETMQRAVLMGVTFFLLLVMIPELYARLEPDKSDEDIAFELQMDNVTIRPDKQPFVHNKLEKSTELNSSLEIDKSTSLLPNGYFFEIHNEDSKFDNVLYTSPDFFEPVEKNALYKAVTMQDKGDLDELPEFAGGNLEMATFIEKQLKYPLEAIKANVQGKVEARIFIGEDGDIDHVAVLDGPGYGCEEEAERVIELMPNWKPGMKNGKPVKVCLTIPIVFSQSK